MQSTRRMSVHHFTNVKTALIAPIMEREHVHRVLDYHNQKYGTHITIDDKTQAVRPDLKGNSDWDWVCYDTETGKEIAVEVKSLRDKQLSEKGKITWRFLEEVQNNLQGKLPGTYHLFPNIPNGYDLPLTGQNRCGLPGLRMPVRRCRRLQGRSHQPGRP